MKYILLIAIAIMSCNKNEILNAAPGLLVTDSSITNTGDGSITKLRAQAKVFGLRTYLMMVGQDDTGGSYHAPVELFSPGGKRYTQDMYFASTYGYDGSGYIVIIDYLNVKPEYMQANIKYIYHGEPYSFKAKIKIDYKQ